MHKFLLSLAFASLFACSFGQQYNCNGLQTIDPPKNQSISWTYPSTWNTNDNAPQYAGGQNCTWKINVPKGTFAYFAIKANTSKAAVLQMTDSTGYVTTFDFTYLQPFFLMDPSFTVSLVSTGVGSMGMTVRWFDVVQVTPAKANVAANGSPLALSLSDFDVGTTITADTRVSLLSIAPQAQITDLTPYMRITQVFDGPSINSTLLGNLHQVMDSGRNLISSGRYLTLYSLRPGYNVGNVAIAQDYNDVKAFTSYKPIWCLMPNICQLSLDATKGTAAALRYTNPSNPFFVKAASIPLTNKLSVYTDFVTDAHRLAVYTPSNVLTDLPQKFNNVFTTFVLNQGTATLQFSSNPVDAKWYTPFEGRHGFFASPYFPMNSAMQNFTDQISGSGKYNVSYTVDKAAFNGGAKLQVTIFDGQSPAVDNVYTSSNYPSGTVRAKGDNLLIQYIPNGVITTGAFVEFQFDKYNSASNFHILGAIIAALWVAL